MTDATAIEALRRRLGARLLAFGGGDAPSAFDARGRFLRLSFADTAVASAAADAFVRGQDVPFVRAYAAPGFIVAELPEGGAAAWRSGRTLLAQGQGAALSGQPVAERRWADGARRALARLSAGLADGASLSLEGGTAHERLALAALPPLTHALLERARAEIRTRWRDAPLEIRRAGALAFVIREGTLPNPRQIVLAWWMRT